MSPVDGLDDATGPAVGAKFEGDNVAAVGPVTLKLWTTTSEVIDIEPNASFEFIAEGYSTWRYEFAERDGADSRHRVVQLPAVRPAGRSWSTDDC